MRLLHAKHQKLILQCYPPGKSVDKKPNPLELSYLLYYASTRRVKLEKVIDFLAHKTKSDAGRNRSGNLQVTLSIIAALIDKCSNNLNVFALQVCKIMLAILNTQELPLIRLLVQTYGVLCSKLDGGLFSGDKDFVDLFCQLSTGLISQGVSKLNQPSLNVLEWKRISLATCRHLFKCIGYNTHVSKSLLSLCVPLLTEQVHSSSSHDDLLKRLHANLNVENDADRRLSKSVTGRSMSKMYRVKSNADTDSLSEDDLNVEALSALRTLFNTTLSSQISDATKEVVENNLKLYPNEEEWGTTFLEMCASWIPVQLRFITLLTLLKSITVTSEKVSRSTDAAHLKSHFARMVHFAKNILGLVSSDFNMIGLSITDVTQRLLSLQTFLHLMAADNLPADKVAYLSSIYSECICNLSSHIYYFDQVLDSIEAILVHMDTVLISTTADNVEQVYGLVLHLLDDVSTVLNLLSAKSSAIIRNRATLENWSVSLQLLSFSLSYKEFLEHGTSQQITQIQAKYLAVFNLFLEKELVKSDSPEQSDSKIGERDDMLVPNFNDYLENSQNILAHLLVHCNDFFEDSILNVNVAAQLVLSLRCILHATGANFIHNFLPFFQHWQQLTYSLSLLRRVKDTLAYILLQDLVEVLESKYNDCFKLDVHLLPLAAFISEDIISRRERGQWVCELDGTSSIPKIIPGELLMKVNKKSIFDFFSHISLHGWTPSQGPFREADVLLENGNGYSEHSMNGQLHAQDFRPVNTKPVGAGLGLGTVSDISSIHSGLANQSSRANVGSADVTQATIETRSMISLMAREEHRVPRVAPLKLSLNGLSISGASSPSVLEKQIHTTDVRSILDGLDSDDDREIVV